jgi:hypothetical protein
MYLIEVYDIGPKPSEAPFTCLDDVMPVQVAARDFGGKKDLVSPSMNYL